MQQQTIQTQPISASQIIGALTTGSLVLTDVERIVIGRLIQARPAANASSGDVKTFAIGERVEFVHRAEAVLGVVQRINDKTIAVRSDDGRDWRVPPRLLSKASADAPLAPVEALDPGRGFRRGDTVSFHARGRMRIGTVTKINEKTISIATDSGDWRVSPHILTKVAA